MTDNNGKALREAKAYLMRLAASGVQATMHADHPDVLLAALVEAVEAAPVGRIDFHCDNMDGVEMCEFSPHGTRGRAKKLDGQRVRVLAVGEDE